MMNQDKISQAQDQTRSQHLTPEIHQKKATDNYLNLEKITRKAAEIATAAIVSQLYVAAHFVEHPEKLPEDLKQKINQAKLKLDSLSHQHQQPENHPENLARTAIKWRNSIQLNTSFA
jgi:hypothetical protein